MDAHYERLRAIASACREETTVCQEATEAYPEIMDINPNELESVAVHPEVPMEEAAMKYFGALKKWHGGRHSAAGRRGRPKDRAQGSRKNLAAGRRWMTRRAGVAWPKGRGLQGHGQDNVV
jgi:hypothetical protein